MPTTPASTPRPEPRRPGAGAQFHQRRSLWASFWGAPLVFLVCALPLLRVWLEKFLLALLERFDEPYRRWQRDFEPPACPPGRDGPLRVAFFFPAGLAAQERQATLDSLQAQSDPGWQAWFAAPEDLAASGLAQGRGYALAGGDLCSLARQTQAGWIVAVSPGVRYAPWLAAQLGAQDERAAAILYWDEDVLDGQGRRHTPFFKPEWSPELWLALDILQQAALARPALLALGGAPAGDPLPLLLAGGQPVLHLPMVMSHLPRPVWQDRQHAAVHQAAAQAWLAAQGLAEARLAPHAAESALLRPDWSPRPELVSIVIPTRDHARDLRRCLESIFAQPSALPYEIVLVDNHSQEPEALAYYQELQATRPQVRLVSYERPFNINAAWNLGAAQARGSLLLFLNNDTAVLGADWLAELARPLQIPGVGIAGARLEYPDGSIQHQGIVLGMTGHANHLWLGERSPAPSPCGPAEALRDVSAVTGACLLVRRALFDQLGGFDEDYQLVFSDVAFCLKARALGWRTALTPYARLLHVEGRSRARYIPAADIRRASAEFADLLRQGDPCYSPNLSLARTRPAPRRRFERAALARVEAIQAFALLRAGES